MTLEEAIAGILKYHGCGHPVMKAAGTLRVEMQRLLPHLRTTEDGVLITPGMVLWYRSPAGIVPTPPMDSWADVEGTIAEDEHYGPDTYYSTRVAAEAAEGGEA